MRSLLFVLFFFQLSAHAALDWQDCAKPPFDFWDNPHAQQCAHLSVPLTYHPDNRQASEVDARTITLALSKLPASGTKQGSLIFISGGPGQASVYPLENIDAFTAVREHFDLIFYDPRGIGLSRPLINCRDENNAIPEKAPEFVNACQQNTPTHFLPHIGSHEATNDVEQIRRALDEARINLIGYSYGTKIAAQYALRFPEQVRAIILDGVVDIFENPYTMLLNQEKSYQHTFEAFLQQCRQNAPCPFGNDSQLRALLTQDAWLRLREQQENARWQTRLQNALYTGGSILGTSLQGAFTGDFSDLAQTDSEASALPDHDILLNILHINLLWQEFWPDLEYALRSYMVGDHFYLKLLAANVEDIEEGLIAINCADMARPMSNGENRILFRHLQHASPYDNLLHDIDDRELLDPCGYWPYLGGDYRQTLPAQAPENLPPLLFIAQRHDPTTPWHNAKRMADYFQSPLITLEGHGHTLTFSDYNTCMDDIALAYLLNPSQAPAQTTCTKPAQELPRYHVYPDKMW